MLGIILLVIWLIIVIGCLSVGVAIGEPAAGVFLALLAAITLGVIFLAIWAVVTVFTFAFSGAPLVVVVAVVILVLLIIL